MHLFNEFNYLSVANKYISESESESELTLQQGEPIKGLLINH